VTERDHLVIMHVTWSRLREKKRKKKFCRVIAFFGTGAIARF
jgi:hypothetical protein